jgi:aminoglycoside phosphotransferase (APT) family kinase protein
VTLADPAAERACMDDALRAGAMRGPLLGALGLPAATSCHVVDAKYEAGSSATVLYQLGQQLVTVVIGFGADPADPVGDAQGGVPVGPGMRAFAFPDDPRLPGLRVAVDPEALAAALAVDPGTRVRVSLLRYRPGKRATLRIDLRANSEPRTLIGKVYAKHDKAAAVFDETRRLRAALGPAPPIVVAPAEAFLPAIPMVLWPSIPGQDLEARLASRRGPELVTAVGDGLAALHAVDPVSERARPIAAELARFDLRAGNIERVSPELGRSLRAWAAALQERGETLEHPVPSLVHGDCKPSQFRLSDSAMALLDFDHCGLADPASDVGTFLATLRQRSLAGLEVPFLDAYTRAVADESGRQRAHWYQSVALLRKALRAFARSPRSPVPRRLAIEGLECLGAVR